MSDWSAGFDPPLPHLDGLANLGAAIFHEADYRVTRMMEGPAWTRERHVNWLRLAWANLHPKRRA